MLKYYGYMSNSKPHVAKYNVAQKGSYIFFLVLMFAQAFTGFALLDNVTVAEDVLLRRHTADAARRMVARTCHRAHRGLGRGRSRPRGSVSPTTSINWLFIIMTTVHVYLSATIDVPVTLDFFGLKKLEIKPHADHGDHAEPATMAVGAK